MIRFYLLLQWFEIVKSCEKAFARKRIHFKYHTSYILSRALNRSDGSLFFELMQLLILILNFTIKIKFVYSTILMLPPVNLFACCLINK